MTDMLLQASLFTVFQTSADVTPVKTVSAYQPTTRDPSYYDEMTSSPGLTSAPSTNTSRSVCQLRNWTTQPPSSGTQHEQPISNEVDGRSNQLTMGSQR